MRFDRTWMQGRFGLERETLRVDKDGRLAQTPHPFDDAQITRDFCENQIELITPVTDSVTEMLDALAVLDTRTRTRLAENGERIWLYSNPPHFETEDDIPVADFRGEQASKRTYREQLQYRYGKRLMLYSGIHFNFSFPDSLLTRLRRDTEDPSAVYMRLYKQLSRMTWLPVLLTAASPVYDRSLDDDFAQGIVLSRYASLRNSERGYWNEFIPILDHTDTAHFAQSIRLYIDKGLLFSPSELYLPVRLKPRGSNTLENLAQGGVDHIELRVFDLNPFAPLGIAPEDAAFAHLLMLYLAVQPDFDYTPAMQEQAVTDHRAAALYDLTGVTIGGVPILERAGQILGEMQEMFADLPEAAAVIAAQQHRLGSRLCERAAASAQQIFAEGEAVQTRR